jgi:hypothetical protein
MGAMHNGHASDHAEPLTDRINVYAPPKLKALTARAAAKARLAMSEYIVRVLADHFDRGASLPAAVPEIGVVRRRVPGRKAKILRGK